MYKLIPYMHLSRPQFDFLSSENLKMLMKKGLAEKG